MNFDTVLDAVAYLLGEMGQVTDPPRDGLGAGKGWNKVCKGRCTKGGGEEKVGGSLGGGRRGRSWHSLCCLQRTQP